MKDKPSKSLSGDSPKDVLVVGIGNPLRSDDGVGPYVAERIEAKSLDHVKVWVTQQLSLEDLEPMLAFSRIILVDAAAVGEGLNFHPIEISSGQVLASSHHLSAETLVRLARSIYHRDMFLELCSIRGHCFDVGSKISKEVLEQADKAVAMIAASLKGASYA